MPAAEVSSIEELRNRLHEVQDYLHLEDTKVLIEQLEQESADPHFWDDAETARDKMSKLSAAKNKVADFDHATSLLQDAEVACELAAEGETEFEEESLHARAQLEKTLQELELASWFTDELDDADAILTIKPGQGGLESQDWSSMLLKMYLAYAERRGWKVEINDAPQAEVIGIDRATITIHGERAYGMLRGEAGVHRLVRISPTDAKKRRQTSFAGVEVLPVLPDSIEIEINPQDLRIDVYHASGPGGQGVNTTDSAVRITHLPTGIVVTCQNERSQLQNKAVCMRILRSKLYDLELQKREDTLNELRGPKHDIAWGNQIRSYVLYPYQMIKDLRTGYETGNVSSVLDDGDLDGFIVAYHRWRVGGSKDLGITSGDEV